MGKTIGLGIQEFSTIIEKHYFYIDKTYFIKQWWESGEQVTLITRPRRFGKTLTMSMLEQFFSLNYAGRGDLFEGMSVWQDEAYHKLQGTYPVISLSFASIKEKNYEMARYKICQLLVNLYTQHRYLRDSDVLSEKDREFFDRISVNMNDADATLAVYQLSDYLYRYYGKRVIVLLDEYDTPMQEAYVDGYWDALVPFTRSMFNSIFKTNPWLERGIMTGITRVSKESVFSDLNNLEVVTTTSEKYADVFGFTEEEVFAAMDEFGLPEKQTVKKWYDGFRFGKVEDIYNPWSVLNYLDKRKVGTYWANTSSNSLAGKLIQEGSRNVKQSFEELLRGGHLITEIDEQIVYNQLDGSEQGIWSLFLASGYLKVVRHGEYGGESGEEAVRPKYELELTNLEVKIMFQNMIQSWFAPDASDYNDFVKALLLGDMDAMNEYMNRVARETFSFFDTGKRYSEKAEPERFYHGFVLGLIVELNGRYVITSNRESGFGRYDIIIEPIKPGDDAFVIEFKVYNPRREKSLEDTVQTAHEQIERMGYEASLLAKGIPSERIRKYAFAFKGKQVLIG